MYTSVAKVYIDGLITLDVQETVGEEKFFMLPQSMLVYDGTRHAPPSREQSPQGILGFVGRRRLGGRFTPVSAARLVCTVLIYTWFALVAAARLVCAVFIYTWFAMKRMAAPMVV